MPEVARQFEAIGTVWEIVFPEADGAAADAAMDAVASRIEAFDKAYSRFRQDSLVTEMSKRQGTWELPEDAGPLIAAYRNAYDRTGGAVTPFIGGLLSDAGYDADYSLTPGSLRDVPAWDGVLLYEAPYLTLEKPVLLDFGAAGKGYLVDLVAEVLAQRGIAEYCIDAGGDILCCLPADKPQRIGLEHPDDSSQVIGVATVTKGALCGSAGNRRKWEGYHHIMDPLSKSSVDRIKAVWAFAGTALAADMLATALFFAEPEAFKDAYDFQWLVVHTDLSVDRSPGFPAELFLS